MQIKWEQDGVTWKAEMGNITLFATPNQMHRFQNKPARGTTWRAGCTHWQESTRTASRYGRDAYMETCRTAKEAMRLAESIYNEARKESV